jgi:hypothetical protein
MLAGVRRRPAYRSVQVLDLLGPACSMSQSCRTDSPRLFVTH